MKSSMKLVLAALALMSVSASAQVTFTPPVARPLNVTIPRFSVLQYQVRPFQQPTSVTTQYAPLQFRNDQYRPNAFTTTPFVNPNPTVARPTASHRAGRSSATWAPRSAPVGRVNSNARAAQSRFSTGVRSLGN